ncbi:PTS glucose transporter subunit IIA [Tsukamurella asaccharolytica]|uniref:PTS glucose transporter subunit IIA n=1 Tax=Tsukamurella asaccharolytica TaxID=2592067 RepID=A0A5C5RCF7_9ACTN|nr:glucose PTS transporter subunit IIA [Tsukamurella asaccharolytica]TWS20378.1 PTS glucose transporter subunit IIA [Tsukamurella asaccharolytica]
MTDVQAPVAGRLLPLSAVPDQVFAAEMVGSGVAIEPAVPDDGADAVVVSPVAGTVLKLHPHAAIVLTDRGVGVLVHVGIDTVGLEGEGFTRLVAEKAKVEAGDPLIAFSPAGIRDRGLSAICPVVVMDSQPGSIANLEERDVAAGDWIFTV